MSLRRFAIIGDIHAEHETLSDVLEFVRGEGVEVVLAVGDIADASSTVTFFEQTADGRMVMAEVVSLPQD